MWILDRPIAEKHGYAQKFAEIGPSRSHVYLLLGYDETIDLPKHIVWEMPTYEGVSRYDLSQADALRSNDGQLTLDVGVGVRLLRWVASRDRTVLRPNDRRRAQYVHVVPGHA